MRYLICIFCLLSITSIRADDVVDYDFRKTRWGMSLDQVELAESKNKDWKLELPRFSG